MKCVYIQSHKRALKPKTEKWKKVQYWVADFHMLKSIRRFWRNKGWGIAIKKGSDDLLWGWGLNFLYKWWKDDFLWNVHFSTDSYWQILHEHPNFFCVFDCVWSIVHNVKDFPNISGLNEVCVHSKSKKVLRAKPEKSKKCKIEQLTSISWSL